MKQNHFLIPYYGNKREEVEEIFNLIKDDLENITTIIEPYCGSCAMSFYISLQYPNKFKYILNDNNENLINLINIGKNENDLENLIKNLNNIQDNIKTKEDYTAFIKNKTFEGWLIANTWYKLRPGMYPTGNRTKYNYNNFLKKIQFLNFIRNENIEIKNNDAILIIEEYKNNEECLLLLDPPYLATCNDFYANASLNIYEYIFNNDLKNNKAKIYCILENIWIIKLLFEKYKSFIYDKTYRLNNKKSKHILIKNCEK